MTVTGAMNTSNILAAQLAPGIGGKRKKLEEGEPDADDTPKKKRGAGKALAAAVLKAAP